ncbi:helix-turn-helix domain-containing protein [Corynebacterium heidelbergense]|uniref:Helix-turn-helix domain-containing protein n=1 Tax=Corynebacterium heidelbergense TaxID=2055947 RepID=A0A364VDQ4_9CORY|nr:helix-turn-helix domain-containing protein [Corynebacterium heidelbergense]RAV34748.1 hypothetical protein CWC39_01485 [Corynebacterium heidelbergense]WCZ37007.1 Helix-turn-helix domain protein [Corynebacterium heidelbergense]
MTHSTASPVAYTPDDLAVMLGIHRTTVIRHANAGKLADLRPYRIGAALRFPRSTVNRRLGIQETA